MAKGDKIVGIDISFSKISLMLGQVDSFDQIQEIVTVSKKVDIPREYNSIGANEQIVASVLSDVVREAEYKAGLRIKSASIMIPAEKTNIIHVEIEEEIKNSSFVVTEEEVISAIIKTGEYMPPKDEWIVDIIPDRFKLDNGQLTKNPIGKKTTTIKLYAQLICCKIDYIESIQKIFATAGLSIDNFAPKILVEKNLFLDAKDQQDNVLVIDMGAKNTEIGILLDGTYIYGETIPYGSDNITKDLEYVFQITDEEAETLKRNYPIALRKYINADNKIQLNTALGQTPEKSITKVSEVSFLIEQRLRYIIEKVKEKFTRSRFSININKIILVGEGISNIRHSDELVESIMGIKTKKADNKLINMVKPEFRMCFALIRYLNLKPFAKNIESKLESKTEKTVFKKMIEKIKDFFYT